MHRSLRRDLGFAAAFGLVLALGPHTSTHLSVSVAGGVAVTALVFAIRRWLRARATSRGVAWDPPVFSSAPGWVWAALALSVAVFAPTIGWLVQHWGASVFQNSYGLFIPLLMALLGLSALRRDPDPRESSSAWGFAFVVLGLGLVAVDSGLRTRFLSVLGLIVYLPGLSLLLLGARRTRRLLLPLALGLFLMPLPNLFASPLGLRETTAVGAEWLLRGIGVAASLDHVRIALPSGEHYLVSDNCAGFQLLPAGFALAAVLAASTRSNVRRALLLLSVVPLALVVNMVRSALLLAFLHFAGARYLQVPLVHGASGVLAFWMLVIALLALADLRGLRKAFA